MATSTRGERPKVFVDSSVLVAAAISRSGSACDLINLGIDDRVELVVSSLVLAETQRNLAREAPHALPVFELIRSYLERRVTDPTQQLVAAVAQTIDEKDAPIVAGAWLVALTTWLPMTVSTC